MKRTIILALLLLGLTALAAQTLPLDLNGYPIQSGKSIYPMCWSPAADTLWDAITIPSGAYKVMIVGAAGGWGIRLNNSNANNYFATVPVNVPVYLDVTNMTAFYVRRAAAGTATIVHMIFYLL